MAGLTGQICRCPVCETTVEILDQGGLGLACCGRAMTAVDVRSSGPGADEHLPVIRQTARSVTVSVGGEPHPMEEDHCLQWLEVVCEGRSYRQFLRPGQQPQATFEVCGEDIVARAYCSQHGLWQTSAGKPAASVAGAATEVL